MFKKVSIFLENKMFLLNKYVPLFLAIYFTANCLPYVFARVPFLDSIFTHSLVSYGIRLVFLGLFVVYGVILHIANKITIKWHLIIFSILLVIFSFVSNVIAPSEVVSYSFHFAGKVNMFTHNVTVFSKLLEVFRFAGGLLFFYFAYTVFPFSFKERKQFSVVLLPVIIIATVGVVYTFIFERQSIINVINGGNPETIKSLFHSKNAYGIFLFNASVILVFLFFYDTRKVFKFLPILIILYALVAYIINCKLAFICILVLLSFSYIYTIFRYYKTRTYVSYSLLGALIAIGLFLVLFFSIPELHDDGLPFKVYNRIIALFTGFDISSFFGRTSEWSYVPMMTKGIFIVFGYSSTIGNLYIQRITAINGATSSGTGDLHNAYVDLYAYHGIIGCIFVGCIYCLLLFKIYKMSKKDLSTALLILFIFAVSILFGMAETYTLFISMSANTFALSFIILTTIQFELRGAQ